MRLLGKYKNGNTLVRIFDNGTKIREYDDEKPVSEFPECIDMTITYRCDAGCKFCYQNCTPSGHTVDLTQYESLIDSLHPYTEVALNGNDITDDGFLWLLHKLKSRNVIANVTVNQFHLHKHLNFLRDLIDKELIYGLGISLQRPTDSFIQIVKTLPNAVIHTINGVTTRQDFRKLYDHDLKILILGYKTLGRGQQFKIENQSVLDNMNYLRFYLGNLIPRFKLVSFDNLALEQLNVKPRVKNWNEFYMGDEGQHTFYADLVHGKYYKSSLESETKGFTIQPNDTIQSMFAKIKEL